LTFRMMDVSESRRSAVFVKARELKPSLQLRIVYFIFAIILMMATYWPKLVAFRIL
jgi:hypothetical protein